MLIPAVERDIDAVAVADVSQSEGYLHLTTHAALRYIPCSFFVFTQNRDRLELYALHKQAVSGDAPVTLSTSTAAERAKYAAWRSKQGISAQEAMRMYVAESDRQIRVYGTSSTLTPENTPRGTLTDGGGTSSPSASASQPRGLAAIPLLCAAASESRQAYLRRLAQTRPEQAWWNRQEPLCAAPNSLLSAPEWIVIKAAALLEWISLVVAPHQLVVVPAAVVQSWLWPFHNVLLGLWMGTILVFTGMISAWDLLQTLLFGSRRTATTLTRLWKDQVAQTSSSVTTLTESHQPLTARLVGLSLIPYTALVGVLTSLFSTTWASVFYILAMAATWWYWSWALPFMAACLLGASVLAGNCFALIELAGV
jgi:acyl-CoA-binding protein